MLVNADFTRSVSVVPSQYHWLASPQEGVERMMLDRVGGEQARATSLVRYAPRSHFPRHAHPGGEEFLVLSGQFSDDAAHFPAGWYVRNPPGSSHQPYSTDGAVIFVKLRQMPATDDRFVRINTHDPATWRTQAGRAICPLFASADESVRIERLDARTPLLPEPVDGAELLVLTGQVHAGALRYPAGSWIRLPAGAYPTHLAGEHGVTVYVKTGRLAPAGAS